jgi:hypothetical protein
MTGLYALRGFERIGVSCGSVISHSGRQNVIYTRGHLYLINLSGIYKDILLYYTALVNSPVRL